MEPIAVNHVTIDAALFAESHDAVFSVKRQKMLLYAGIVFLAFGLVLLAVQLRFPVASALAAPALITGVLVVIWAMTLKRSELRRKYRAFKARNGEASQRTIRCYRAFLEVDTGRGEPAHIDYPDIREFRETEHLCLLICNNHTGVQLARNGFESGSWEQLQQAIERARLEAQQALEL